MSGDNEVSVKVAANTGELKPGMEAAANAVKSSVEQMQGAFKGLEGVLAGIQSHILAFTAVMAGGALFGSSIKAANEWNSEVTKISKTMGMTTEQASVMAVALDHIGVSTDTFTHASTMLTRQLSGNEGAFKTLGVATRDANTGAFRPTGDIMVDVNEKLKSIHNTTERNAAGMKVYGRSWEEVRTILKLTPEAMKESEETAKRLHLIVGPEGAAMTRKYKEEMRDFHLILNSLSIQIGNALLPVMMKLGSFMGEEGPAMGDVFKKVIQSIAFAAGAAWLTLKDMGDGIGAMAAQAVALLHGDLAGFKAIGAERDKQAAENEAAYERLKASMFDDGPMKTGGKTEEDDAHIDFNKGTKDQIAAWKSTLEQAHEVEGQYFKDSLQSDIAFWDEKLGHVKRGSKEERAVRHELYALHKQDAQANLAAAVADIQYRIALEKNDTAEKVNLAKQEAELIKNTYGEKSKEYILQLRKIEDAERAHKETMNKLELERIDQAKAMKVSALDLDRENLRFQKEMGDISAAQELTALRALKEQEYQIELKAAKEKLDFIKGDVVAKETALDEIAKMEAKHGIEMSKNAHDTALAVKAAWQKMLDPITSAFDTSIKGMILGTTTFQKAWQNMGSAIVGSFASAMSDEVKKFAAKELAKTQLAQAGTAMRTMLEKMGLVEIGGLQKSASVETVSTKAAEATGVVGANAAEAASGAAASQASIPVVGWGLSITAFAGVMAMVMGAKSSIPSARGGWDIPAGINPMTQLHEREMVLPAAQADVVRSMAGGGGSGGDVHLHVHGGLIDAKGFETWLKGNSHTLAPALRNLGRNFTPIKV